LNTPFPIHCIAWQAGAPLLREMREAAGRLGLLTSNEVRDDELDEVSRHAFVISKRGQGIGYARMTPAGRIERMVVLLHENSTQIEAALIEVLQSYAKQIGLGKETVMDLKPTA